MPNLYNLPVEFFYFLAVWELLLKGFALWQASKRNHKIMFVFLLIINSVGILPLSYIIFNYVKERKVVALPEKKKVTVKNKKK